MSVTHDMQAEPAIPTIAGALIFRFKSLLLQIRRFFKDAADASVNKGKKSVALVAQPVIAESKTPLWTETAAEERHLVAGKIQNLRLAVAELNGVEIAASETFSFWKNVGRTTPRRGFVAGRELREGCIIPNVGGGLCQLSNALYDAALKANFEIIERHAHTRIIAGSLAEQGRDATVFWNYVDLRFRAPSGFRIEASLGKDHLRIYFRGTRVESPRMHKLTRTIVTNGDVNSCATCGMDDCFRSIKPSENTDFGKTAYLVDEFTPEFDTYLKANKNGHDELFLPIDGKRFRRANYAWNTSGFANVKQQLYLTALRSYRSRKLATQGAARQRNLLAMSERLAQSYARNLRFDALHIVVQQELLPFLWRGGHLGGRTFDVLMTALPMAEIQTRLDAAHKLHTESRTLADFRADENFIGAETEALAAANKIITPHTAVAALFPDKAELLSWKMPEVSRTKNQNDKPVIVFPASTVGRKGCYELREAIRDLDVKLITLGPYIEDAEFWNGFDVVRGGDDWLDHADLVVLPAFVEHRPRRLLRAAAVGVPVIASTACGVDNIANITTIDAGDIESLRRAIAESSDLSSEAHIDVRDAAAIMRG
jgi:hypothetical protein